MGERGLWRFELSFGGVSAPVNLSSLFHGRAVTMSEAPGDAIIWNVSSCAKHGRSVARIEFGYPIAGVAI